MLGASQDTASDKFHVLILGDGNFSFSLALVDLLYNNSKTLKSQQHLTDSRISSTSASESESVHSEDVLCQKMQNASLEESHQNNPALTYLNLPAKYPRTRTQITTTSFDKRSELYEKYPESRPILQRLDRYECLGVQVLHSINAWELPTHFPNTKFDRIIWNHPHLGTENFALHRFLMAHFFDSCAKVLKDDGLVCVSLVYGQETRWSIVTEAARAKLQLSELRPFYEDEYPGYVCKRNKTGESFKNSKTLKHVGHAMRSFTYKFGFGTSSSTTSAIPVEIPVSAQPTTQIVIPGLPAPNEPTTPVKQYQCHICHSKFNSERGHKQHVHMVHTLKLFGDWKPNSPRILHCDAEGCNKTFRKTDDLWQHRVNKHSQARLDINDQTSNSTIPQVKSDGDLEYEYYPCPICSQAVHVSEGGMEVHLETLKPLVGLDVRCPVDGCGRKFTEGRALGQHWLFCRLCVRNEPIEKNCRTACTAHAEE